MSDLKCDVRIFARAHGAMVEASRNRNGETPEGMELAAFMEVFHPNRAGKKFKAKLGHRGKPKATIGVASNEFVRPPRSKQKRRATRCRICGANGIQLTATHALGSMNCWCNKCQKTTPHAVM